MDENQFLEIINKMKDTDYLLLPKNDNVLKTWLEYKYPKLLNVKQGDLDVSERAIVTYALELMNFKSTEYKEVYKQIQKQEGCNELYRICLDSNFELRGDWLTSPLHIIKLYLGLLWEDSSTTRSDFKKLFKKTTSSHLLYALEGTWENYIYTNVDVVWDCFHEEAKKFLLNSVSYGNFVMMPIYINPCRCKQFGGDDTFDTLLWKMYCCFEADKNSKEKIINTFFVGKNQDAARENVLKWMKLYNNRWDDFVKCNYLNSAVAQIDGGLKKKNKEFGPPLDFRTGNPITCEIGECYNPLPENLLECVEMMRNYNKYVEERTLAINQLIQKANI